MSRAMDARLYAKCIDGAVRLRLRKLRHARQIAVFPFGNNDVVLAFDVDGSGNHGLILVKPVSMPRLLHDHCVTTYEKLNPVAPV